MYAHTRTQGACGTRVRATPFYFVQKYCPSREPFSREWNNRASGSLLPHSVVALCARRAHKAPPPFVLRSRKPRMSFLLYFAVRGGGSGGSHEKEEDRRGLLPPLHPPNSSVRSKALCAISHTSLFYVFAAARGAPVPTFSGCSDVRSPTPAPRIGRSHSLTVPASVLVCVRSVTSIEVVNTLY